MENYEKLLDEAYKKIKPVESRIDRFEMPKVEEPVFPENQVSISDFGAIGDGHTLNTEAITKAINNVAEKGGGRVVIPRGVWLTGPIVLKSNIGKIALAHNGNLINYEELKKELEDEGFEFSTNSDSEVIGKIFATASGDEVQKLKLLAQKCRGAYSVVIASLDKLIGFRDPWGVRPLCIGKLNSGWVLSSESCALNTIGAQYVREVEAGEAVIIDEGGLSSYKIAEKDEPACCIFEYIYFARPDSVFHGKSIYQARLNMGKTIALEHPADDADAVLAIPDSSLPASIGYSRQSKIYRIEFQVTIWMETFDIMIMILIYE